MILFLFFQVLCVTIDIKMYLELKQMATSCLYYNQTESIVLCVKLTSASLEVLSCHNMKTLIKLLCVFFRKKSLFLSCLHHMADALKVCIVRV